MEQDRRKDDLKKLLQFLDTQILRDSQNNWFAKDLYKILAPTSDARISDIHEQCIQDILKSQARQFYSDFVIADIRETLISDFIKMEHWRRLNNLSEFGMAVFQQIECIINRLSRNVELCNISHNLMNAKCYVDSISPQVSNRYSKSTYTIGQLLFISDAPSKSLQDLSTMYVLDKFKTINYYVCHKAIMTANDFNQFVEENRTFGQLYALRNQNHRGNNLTEKEKLYLGDILLNNSKSFIRLYAFLIWFVDSVNQGFPISNELIEFSKNDFSNVVPAPIVGPKILGKIDLPPDNKKRRK